MIAESVVDEMRAAQLDLLARAKFAKDGEQIYETRTVIEDLFDDGSGVLEEFMDFDMVEIG